MKTIAIRNIAQWPENKREEKKQKFKNKVIQNTVFKDKQKVCNKV